MAPNGYPPPHQRWHCITMIMHIATIVAIRAVRAHGLSHHHTAGGYHEAAGMERALVAAIAMIIASIVLSIFAKSSALH